MVELNEKQVEKYFNELVDKGLISKEDILFDKDDTFNENFEEIKRVVTNGARIKLSENGITLLYEDEGVWKEVPEMDDGIENAVEELERRIPEFTFKTSENFSIFKNNEIENLYICAIVAGIIREDFKIEFEEVLKEYDIDEIEDSTFRRKTFTKLLKEWQELQSKTLQAIISACRSRIISKKEAFSSLNLSKLRKKDATKLKDLKDSIRTYVNQFKKENLTEEKLRSKKKHEIFKLYDERDTFVKESIINAPKYSDVKTFYFIDKLNSEDIRVLDKKKITNLAKKYAMEQLDGTSPSEDIVREYTNRFFRKGCKVYLRKWVNEELDLYLKDRINYNLPKKV